ncbi:MAG TPA: MFS transporter [Burkholderiaceae bacterium]|nr:MFS transporter [Burkholderiaceae bacterium]
MTSGDGRPSRRTALVLTALMMAEITSSFETGMIYSALAKLYGVFGDPIGVGWLVTGFLLVAAGATVICGRLGDLFGRRRVMIAMLLCAGVGSAISAVSTDLEWVIFGRAVQGMSAAILPLCFGLLRENLPESRVPIGVGIIAATATVGAGAGLILGGLIVDHLTWPWIFYCSGGFAVVSIASVLLWVPPSARPKTMGSLDVLGGVLFVPAIAGLLLAISKGKSWGWIDIRALGLIACSLALLALWVVHELRQKNPLINVRLFADRQVALANLAMALFGIGTSQAMLVLLLLMQQPSWTVVGLGVSATVAALLKLPSNLLATVAAPWSGYIAAQRGARQALLVGIALVTLGWIAITAYHGSIWFLAPMIVFVGFGGAMMYAAMPNLIVEIVPADRIAETTGLQQVVRATATAIGAQIASFMLASSTVSDPAQGPGTYPSAAAYTLALIFITTTAVACLLVTLALPRRKRSNERAGTATEHSEPGDLAPAVRVVSS